MRVAPTPMRVDEYIAENEHGLCCEALVEISKKHIILVYLQMADTEVEFVWLNVV